MGVDDTDNDFKISRGSVLGTTDSIVFSDTAAEVGIAGAPQTGFALDVAGQLQITLDGDAVANEGICGTQADGDVADTANITISDCATSVTADYMEMYAVEQGVETGDIIAPG